MLTKHCVKPFDIKIDHNNNVIEILSEYGGENLSYMDSLNYNTAMHILFQLLNTLGIMEHIGISYFDIKNTNLVYNSGLLKILDLETDRKSVV